MHADSEAEQKRRTAEPMGWFNKSSDLRASAGAVWYCIRHPELQVPEELELGEGFSMKVATWPVYLMLCGLSLELVYKAVAVCLGRDPGIRHDLCRLAGNVGVLYSAEEQGLLRILTECIQWHGRYPAPVPKHHDAIQHLYELSSTHLTERVANISLNVRRPKDPHPLGWEAFTRLWLRGAQAFAEKQP